MPAMRAVVTLLLLLMAPTAAFAVTVDQIVALSRAGMSKTVILALIDRDKTVFSLEPDQLLELQHDGVSEPVILAMLKSGRAEGAGAAAADAATNAAFSPANNANNVNNADIVNVDPYPQAANTGYRAEPSDVSRRSSARDANAGVVYTYVLPYLPYLPYYVPLPDRSHCATVSPVEPPQAISTRGIFFTPPATATTSTTGMFFGPPRR
jgi:hypothetical protein